MVAHCIADMISHLGLMLANNDTQYPRDMPRHIVLTSSECKEIRIRSEPAKMSSEDSTWLKQYRPVVVSPLHKSHNAVSLSEVFADAIESEVATADDGLATAMIPSAVMFRRQRAVVANAWWLLRQSLCMYTGIQCTVGPRHHFKLYNLHTYRIRSIAAKGSTEITWSAQYFSDREKKRRHVGIRAWITCACARIHTTGRMLSSASDSTGYKYFKCGCFTEREKHPHCSYIHHRRSQIRLEISNITWSP